MVQNRKSTTFVSKLVSHFPSIIWIAFGNGSIVPSEDLFIALKAKKTITFDKLAFHLELLKVYLNQNGKEKPENLQTHSQTGH